MAVVEVLKIPSQDEEEQLSRTVRDNSKVQSLFLLVELLPL